MGLLHLESDCYRKEALHQLETHFAIDCLNTDEQSIFQTHLKHKNYEVIFTKLGLWIGKEEMDLVPHLKYIVTPTTGLNHIDLEEANLRNISVISLKGESKFLKTITSTSEHTWGLLLALVRNMIPATVDVEQGHWRRKPFMGFDLREKTIGVIGYGRLGKIVANYAHAFEMKVLVNDTDSTVFEDCPNWIQVVSLDTLLAQSQVITIHIPYSEKNNNFFNEAKFSQLKQTPFFINTSRGEVVEEKALLKALKNKWIKAAGVDVLRGDSSWGSHSNVGNELIEYAKENTNLLISPHMGGYGDNSIFNTRTFIVQKFLNAFQEK